MSVLGSYGDQLRVAIVGASGGIGGAFVEALAECPGVAAVEALSRSDPGIGHANVRHRRVDLEDEASIAGAAEVARAKHGAIDVVIVASGILHDDDGLQPEKTWRAIDPAAFAKVLAVNTIGPALVAKHFLPLLARDRKAAFAVLSARVGSIADNQLGGWYAYRASKAAVNMLVKTFSIELGRRNPHAVCVGLHPGTVATALSAPFQGGAPATKLFPPARAAAQLLAAIDARTAADSGGLFAWDGSRIPF